MSKKKSVKSIKDIKDIIDINGINVEVTRKATYKVTSKVNQNGC